MVCGSQLVWPSLAMAAEKKLSAAAKAKAAKAHAEAVAAEHSAAESADGDLTAATAAPRVSVAESQAPDFNPFVDDEAAPAVAKAGSTAATAALAASQSEATALSAASVAATAGPAATAAAGPKADAAAPAVRTAEPKALSAAPVAATAGRTATATAGPKADAAAPAASTAKPLAVAAAPEAANAAASRCASASAMARAGGHASAIAEPTVGGPAVDLDLPLIRRAAGLRIKYRTRDVLVRLPLDQVGFHPKNRDGQPPNGERCCQLTDDIVRLGFDRDEADAGGVCVEQKPGTFTIAAFNLKACELDLYHATPKDECICFGSLSHSHLHQVLKNIRAGIKGTTKSIVDQNGNYSLALLRAADMTFALVVTPASFGRC